MPERAAAGLFFVIIEGLRSVFSITCAEGFAFCAEAAYRAETEDVTKI